MAKHFKLNTSGVVEFSGSQSMDWLSNAKFKFAASTFQIVGADDAVLSADNPLWVTFNHGETSKTLELTTSPEFIDDTGASDIVGMQYGRATGVVQGVMPMYVYVTYDTSDNVLFFISPDWNKKICPSTTAEMGYHGNPSTNNADTDIFILSAADNRAVLTSQPCRCVGSIEMSMSTSDDWTVATLGTDDGIGQFKWGKEFDVPVSQPSAVAAGKHLLDNGGTAPAFTTNKRKYAPLLGGFCEFSFNLEDNGANGSGAVTLYIGLPYAHQDADGATLGTGGYVPAPGIRYVANFNVSGATKTGVSVLTPGVSGTALQNTIAVAQNGTITTASRLIESSIIYRPFHT